MKKIGFVFLVLLLVSSTGKAQPRSIDPEEIAKSQTAQLKEELSLNAEQEEKVYEVNLKSIKKMSELREKARGGNGMEGIREKMMKVREEQNTKMKEILTEEQWTKYEKYQEERRSRMRERRRQ